MASRRPGAHPGNREAIPTAWSSSRPSGSDPDGLELIQAIRKPSRRPGAHPGHREAISTAWRSSRPSGSHLDGLEVIQAIGKPSRRPGGATRALQKIIPTAWSSSRPSGTHLDGLEVIQAIGKPSRRPGGATVRALQKMLRALNFLDDHSKAGKSVFGSKNYLPMVDTDLACCLKWFI
ncbi:hypothetical protein H4Q26_004947 [Puccinia striiformis f. sp. tritici PST-130]|nr:hypothetical protein H4Q26_004947 [Puccinia striiformis f. sp. tritici PST-130]